MPPPFPFLIADELSPIRPVASCVSTCATTAAAVVVERERTKQTRAIVCGAVAIAFILLLSISASRAVPVPFG